MRVRRHFTMLLALAFCLGSLLTHPLEADATRRDRVKTTRRFKRKTKNPKVKVVEVRLRDKPARLEHLLDQENRDFLGKVRLDPRLARSLVDRITHTLEGSSERALVLLFNEGLSSLRGMYGKARTISGKEALKIETSRLAATADTLLAARALVIDHGQDGSKNVTSPRARGTRLTVARNRFARWVETSLAGKESLVAFRDNFLIRPVPNQGNEKTQQELWEDTRNLDPRATRPIDRIGMRLVTYEKRNGSKDFNWMKFEATLITAAEEGRTWQTGVKESNSDWAYTTHKGWKTLSKGPIRPIADAPRR